MVRFFICLVLLIFSSCGDHQKKNAFRIGIDPYWTSLNLYGQEKNVNGFLEELLMEIAHESGLIFLWVNANWDSLFTDMQRGRTDASFSSIPKYNFNEARFDFSKPILELGSMLIVPQNSSAKNVMDLKNKRVGVLADDQSALTVLKIPEVIMHSYNTVPDLLNAIVREEVDGGILDRLLATSYTRDLFAGTLKVIGTPLTDLGIRLIVLKGKERDALHRFNKALSQKKLVEPLLKKWQLVQ